MDWYITSFLQTEVILNNPSDFNELRKNDQNWKENWVLLRLKSLKSWHYRHLYLYPQVTLSSGDSLFLYYSSNNQNGFGYGNSDEKRNGISANFRPYGLNSMSLVVQDSLRIIFRSHSKVSSLKITNKQIGENNDLIIVHCSNCLLLWIVL